MSATTFFYFVSQSHLIMNKFISITILSSLLSYWDTPLLFVWGTVPLGEANPFIGWRAFGKSVYEDTDPRNDAASLL